VSTYKTLTLGLTSPVGSTCSHKYETGGSGVELPLSTPSPEHVEFDQMTAEIDEFEPLPSMVTATIDAEPEGEEEASLDSQILAGLVTPC
jgi:hypothetical protein